MAVTSEVLSYQADGLTMRSHLYLDDAATGPRQGILVFPAIFGLDDHTRSRAERLAGLGFAALACDIHGEGAVVEGIEAAQALAAPMRQEPAKILARARGGLDALVARPEVGGGKIAAIGFCFGGMMALELARSGADIAATVGFHSSLATTSTDAGRNIKGKVLACIGADDPGVPPEQRAAFETEMRAGGVDWRLHVYGGVVHSFTNPAADAAGRLQFSRYDAGADRRSWAEMMALFGEVFG